MAALGWLLNLNFAASASAEAAPVRGGGGYYRPRSIYYAPDVGEKKKPYTEKSLKTLLRKVAETNNEDAKRELEQQARTASDAVEMIRDVQTAIRDLSGQMQQQARELEYTHQWAQKMIERMEDERIILAMLLESD